MAIDYRTTYADAVRKLRPDIDRDRAMRLAVGGDFESLGVLQREILVAAGLRPGHFLVDVGCGSGRLASALKSYLTGRYLGIDILPELLDYAREISARPDWRFEEAAGVRIPEEDGAADMVCLFSVLTHLLHQDGFLYLAEAARVLKPGGTIVFTFLDFSVQGHWPVFQGMLADRMRGETTHHNQFMAREMIPPWAARLGLVVEAVLDGDAPQVHLTSDVTLDDGRVLPRDASIGQSICVLRKGALIGDEEAGRPAAGPAFLTREEIAATYGGSREHAFRLAELERRMAGADAGIAHLQTRVLPIIQGRTWRTAHAVRSWLHAMFARRDRE